jgi:hypothetical protein
VLTFGSPIINDLPLVVHQVLLLQAVLVENAGIGVIGVLHAENAMAPTVLDYPVALAKEHLLSFHGVEIVELSFNVLQFGASLGGSAEVPGVNEKPGLRIF